MKILKRIPSCAALAAAVGGMIAPLDPIRVLISLTFAGVALLLWPLAMESSR